MAYYQLEPWGEDQADRRAAVIASTMANIHRGKNKRPYRIEDFMPKFDRPKQTWKDIKDRFTRAFGIK
jgi:hypothetical protein